MRVADPRLQVLPSFIYRAGLRLAELSRLLVSLQLTEPWESPYIQQVLADAKYLRHGLRTLANPGTLTLDEQRYICERLLPAVVESSAGGVFVPPTPVDPEVPTVPQVPLSLTLTPLAAKVRGAAVVPLPISGVLRGTFAAGALLTISRDGQRIHSQPAQAGSYSYQDATPGLTYVVQVTNTTLRRAQTRTLRSPILAGVLPVNATPAQLVLLPSFYPGIAATGIGRFTFTGLRQRIYMLIPVENGPVLAITQPNDNNADIAIAFITTSVTLDFGVDGTAEYQQLVNFANFIGTFTLDLHLRVGSVVTPPVIVDPPVITPPVPRKLAVPSGLLATVAGTTVNLSWGSVTDAVTYQLQRALVTENGVGSYVPFYTGTTRNYADTGRTREATYAYQVRAVGNGTSLLTSDFSTAVQAKIPALPIVITPTPVADTYALLYRDTY